MLLFKFKFKSRLSHQCTLVFAPVFALVIQHLLPCSLTGVDYRTHARAAVATYDVAAAEQHDYQHCQHDYRTASNYAVIPGMSSNGDSMIKGIRERVSAEAVYDEASVASESVASEAGHEMASSGVKNKGRGGLPIGADAGTDPKEASA